ncbi:alpha/beta fold hydrolase [bacterium]|jgi:cis-3-alkyl-4-acyloxetan-2-one decarboxylase|nr:alpha/beta fold hydrolase [Pirellulaceae bacterium]MDB4724389.1 alpha/beta fold hydrolase [bacterium]
MSNNDWQKEFPFESKFFDQGGVRQHYIDEGEGEPIVMVHGNPTWSFYYRHLISSFRSTHRVVAVDHVGCGLSDKPKKYKYRLSTHVHNLKNIVSNLKLENATLVVHDWGGPIGLGMWMILMQRFKRVVLLNTAAYIPKEIPFGLQVARWPILGAIGVRGLNLFCKKALTTGVADSQSLDAVARQGLLAPYDSWANRVAVHNFVLDIPLKTSHPSYSGLQLLETALPQLAEIPVKMIWGMKDWVFNGDVLDEMIRRIPHAEVNRLENVGHYVMEEGREQVVELVQDFVGR